MNLAKFILRNGRFSEIKRKPFCPSEEIFFLNQPTTGVFFVYFQSFQTNNTIFQQINVKKCPNVHPVYSAGI